MNQVNELDFVHLHVHSEFSLVDGIIRVKELVNNSANRGFHSVALTDLTNLFGLVTANIVVLILYIFFST